MPATMKDIARETGLGLATISKYLNGGNVRPENKILIDKAIKKLDYMVNEMARGLKSKRSTLIGVVIPELSNIFITTIITAIEDSLRQKGYSVVVCDCHSNRKLECEAVRFLLRKGIDGLVNMPTSGEGQHLLPAIEKGVPVVLVDRLVSGLSGQVDAVLVDNAKASYDAVSHLLKNGHREIGIILGPKEIFTSGERLSGYAQAMKAYGLPLEEKNIIYSDYTTQGGYESMRALLKRKDLTAAFVTNYEMTLGAIIALNERNVKIPEEISLIGFDNMQLSQIVHPKLTVVTQPLEDMGAQISNLLLGKLSGGERKPALTLSLSTSLSLGDSVAKPGR